MTTVTVHDDLQELLQHNRGLQTATALLRIEAIERQWVHPLVAQLEADAPDLPDRATFRSAFDALLAKEAAEPSDSAVYVEHRMTRAEFAVVVGEYAIDGLTEAQNFFPAVPRLPIRAQMAVMRVIIDEFGCGNLKQAHSQLYCQLLVELGLPTDLQHYVDSANTETYALANVFFWLAQRAPQIEYFLGGLAYLEASIPSAFQSFARACDRLDVNGHYYMEHLHIDAFHMQEMQDAIREVERVRPVDYPKVWAGVRLLSDVLADALDAAVDRARKCA